MERRRKPDGDAKSEVNQLEDRTRSPPCQRLPATLAYYQTQPLSFLRPAGNPGPSLLRLQRSPLPVEVVGTNDDRHLWKICKDRSCLGLCALQTRIEL